jgi:hypothetical protein
MLVRYDVTLHMNLFDSAILLFLDKEALNDTPYTNMENSHNSNILMIQHKGHGGCWTNYPILYI